MHAVGFKLSSSYSDIIDIELSKYLMHKYKNALYMSMYVQFHAKNASYI